MISNLCACVRACVSFPGLPRIILSHDWLLVFVTVHWDGDGDLYSCLGWVMCLAVDTRPSVPCL